jgi:hypothetical protein
MTTEEKVINYVQQQIMDNWRSVMKYEDQLRNIAFHTEEDHIIYDCIANAKERIEIYTLILNKFEE